MRIDKWLHSLKTGRRIGGNTDRDGAKNTVRATRGMWQFGEYGIWGWTCGVPWNETVATWNYITKTTITQSQAQSTIENCYPVSLYLSGKEKTVQLQKNHGFPPAPLSIFPCTCVYALHLNVCYCIRGVWHLALGEPCHPQCLLDMCIGNSKSMNGF